MRKYADDTAVTVDAAEADDETAQRAEDRHQLGLGRGGGRGDRRLFDARERGIADLGALDALQLREVEADSPRQTAVQTLADAERFTRSCLPG